MANPELVPQGLEVAAEALRKMYRGIDSDEPFHLMAETVLTAYLGSTGAVAPEPYMWVKEWPAVFDPQNGGEPVSTEFLDGPTRVGAFPLYRHAPADTGHGGRVETATHRHKKRGSEYVLIGFGKMQAEDWLTGDTLAYSVDCYSVAEIKEKLGVDMRAVAIYRSVDDGLLWVRPREEFEDGRFEAIAPTQEGEAP